MGSRDRRHGIGPKRRLESFGQHQPRPLTLVPGAPRGPAAFAILLCHGRNRHWRSPGKTPLTANAIATRKQSLAQRAGTQRPQLVPRVAGVPIRDHGAGMDQRHPAAVQAHLAHPARGHRSLRQTLPFIGLGLAHPFVEHPDRHIHKTTPQALRDRARLVQPRPGRPGPGLRGQCGFGQPGCLRQHEAIPYNGLRPEKNPLRWQRVSEFGCGGKI